MMSFFRRHLSSWMAVALFAIILVAFIVTGVDTSGGGLMGGTGDAVATVGGSKVAAADVAARIDAEVRRARQQDPTVTPQALIAASGGIDSIVDQMVTARLLERWSLDHGLTASKKLVDGEIASIPAFQGPTGKFDQRQMEGLLAQQRLSYPQLRDGVREDLLRRQLVQPIVAGVRMPAGVARHYARLLIARREGLVGVVPMSAADLPAPTEDAVKAWYAGHLAQYTLPERRVIQYAAIDTDTAGIAAPSEAEIAAAYKADAAKYAGGETRTVSQVVLPDAAAAKGFSAKVAGGTAFARAAADAGFGAGDIALGTLSRDALAKASAPAVATAAFALPNGGTSQPIQTPLGFAIVHVDAVQATPGRPLAAVRGEIAAALATRKGGEAVAALVQKIEDAIDKGATFDEVVKQNRLTVVTTPALTASGIAPADQSFRPDATLTPLLRAGFDAAADDEPTVETIVPEQRFALVKVRQVLPAAPIPLAQVRLQVTQQVAAKQASDRAEATARAVLAKVNAGTPLAQALAAAKLPAPRPVAGTQMQLAQLAQSGQQPPAPLRALFRLLPGKSDVVAQPGVGWFIVHLDRLSPGDPAMLAPLERMTQGELTQGMGEEYVQQFANAARADVKIVRRPAAIAELAKQYAGGGQADTQ